MKTLATASAITSRRFLPGFAALVLGLAVILGVGFMQDANNILHNAAHDNRHHAGFPCH